MKKIILLAALAGFLALSRAGAATSYSKDTVLRGEMNEVTVLASRTGTSLKDLPQKVEIVSRKMLESLPAENLAEVLKRTTNLDIIQYPGLSATVGMRGFSPSAHSRSYVLLLINGQPSGTTNLASIPTEQIERVEIVKGPYSVLYGSDAMGGVINVITRNKVLKPTATFSIEKGSFGYSKESFSVTAGASDKLSYGLGYSHQQQTRDYRIGRKNLLRMDSVQQFMLDKASRGDAMDNTQYELNAANAFARWNLGHGWNVYTEGTYTFAYDVETAGNYWGSYGQSKKDINRLNLQAAVEKQSTNNLLRFAPYLSNEENYNYTDNTDAGYVSFSSLVKEQGYQLQDVYRWNGLSLLAGHDLKTYQYTSDRYSAIGTPATPYKPDNQFLNAAAFTQLSWDWKDLRVNGGLRYDFFQYHIDANPGLNAPASDADYHTLNPSVGVQYKVFGLGKVHSSYGSAYSVPDAYKVAGKYTVSGKSYVGNADLKPERSNTVDLGWNYTNEAAGVHADLTYFRTDYDQKIVEQVLTTGEYTYVNANKSLMEGLELMSEIRFGQWIRKDLDLKFFTNITWLMTDNFTQVVNNQSLKRDMQYVRRWNANGGFAYAGSKFEGLISSRFMGHRLEKDNFAKQRPKIKAENYYTKGGYTAADKILEHPEVLVFDASVGYRFRPDLKVGFVVANVLDENYTEKDGYNMPGRSITAKVSYRF